MPGLIFHLMSLDSDTWLAGGSTDHRSFSTFMPMPEAAATKITVLYFFRTMSGLTQNLDCRFLSLMAGHGCRHAAEIYNPSDAITCGRPAPASYSSPESGSCSMSGGPLSDDHAPVQCRVRSVQNEEFKLRRGTYCILLPKRYSFISMSF